MRNQAVAKEDLLALVKGPNLNVIQKALGVHAVRTLQERFGGFTTTSLQKRIAELTETEIILPIEIDKTRLSSGEKQIFVMSLYWAMMNQSKNDILYVIDTPFARIDTEHRANITEHFFKNLNGQLMVLSTDEEISGDHIMSMKDQIARVYMLEYGPDKRTYIYDNQYFEV